MAKVKTVYQCTSCGAQQSKWAGSCSQCGEWNTLEEVVVNKSAKVGALQSANLASATVRKLHEVSQARVERFSTGFAEIDRVLGGGIVPGSLILLAGQPGIGKSTLLLQLLGQLTLETDILYVAGEESVEQIASRADRLGGDLADVKFLAETDIATILAVCERENPSLLVVDSVSVVRSADLGSVPGSLPQIRLITDELMRLAKQKNMPIFLVGHVTKEGLLAGPKMMEHMVDVVLQIEGQRYGQLRLLRAIKNRFGSTQEVGLLEMCQQGLREVKNPGALLLQDRAEKVMGSILTVTLDGNRPFLVEVQALVSRTHFGYPKRSATGFDVNRLQMLIAVLEKYHNLKLGDYDVYVNVVGGIKIKEPGCDLAIMEAIKSSYQQKLVSGKQVVFGEVGLDGRVRDPYHKELREREVKAVLG